MNRKYFNFKLYKDMLRQLRLIGIIYGVICIVISILPVIINALDSSATGLNTIYGLNMPSIANTTPALMVFMYVGAITFVFAAFSFLNKRSSSDYYHSLPNTRERTYLSLLSAALTWIYGIIICTVLITWLGYAITGLPFNNAYIPWLLMSNIAGSTFVAGAAVIAVSITGTLFSNIIVTGLVILLPRFIFMLYSIAIMSIAPIAGTAELGILLNPAANLPTAFVFNILSFAFPVGKGFSELFFYSEGILYTAIVGVLYLVLGGILFHVRKSESAGKSAPNRILQHIYRCGITLPFLLILSINYVATRDTTYYFGYNFGMCLTILVISLIVYFVFEIITTRKVRNLLTALPWYLAVAAMAFIFAIGARDLGNSVLNTTPSAQEIKYAYLNVSQQTMYSQNSEKAYTRLLTEKIRYENPEINQILSDGLKRTVQQIKQNNNVIYNNTSVIATYALTLTDGKTISRQITLSNSEYARLHGLQLQNSEYKSVYRSVPKDSEISSIYISGMDKTTSKHIWDIYKEEIKNLSDAEYSTIVENTGNMVVPTVAVAVSRESEIGLDNNPFDSFSIFGSIGVENYHSSYSLTKLTPKATALYMDAVFKAGYDSIQKNIDYGVSFTPGNDGQYFNYSLSLFNVTANTQHQYIEGLFSSSKDPYNKSNITADMSKQLFSILKEGSLKAGNPEKPGVIISCSSNITKGNSDGRLVYLEITDEQAKAILEIMGTLSSR